MPVKKIRVLYAEDHPGFRKAVMQELESFGIQVIAGVSNGKELIDTMSPRPDVILLDLEMPVMDGSQTFNYLRQHWPEARVIIVSMHYDELLVENYIERGARGYISKDTFAGDIELLVDTIHKVAAGEISVHKTPLEQTKFSSRQKEMIPFIVEGCTNKEISAHTGILERSVEKQKQRIYNKMGGRAVDFYRYAFSRGLQFLGKVKGKQ